jgi:hypothetical protein
MNGDLKDALDNPIVFVLLLIMILFPLVIILRWLATSAKWGGVAQALGG